MRGAGALPPKLPAVAHLAAPEPDEGGGAGARPPKLLTFPVASQATGAGRM